jgi:hypothetical protein
MLVLQTFIFYLAMMFTGILLKIFIQNDSRQSLTVENVIFFLALGLWTALFYLTH